MCERGKAGSGSGRSELGRKRGLRLPHRGPAGRPGQARSLERVAEEDAVGFGFATCENLLWRRHLQLQYECL